jgi:hypothetical protein
MGEIGGMVAGWLEAEFHEYMRHKSERDLESKVLLLYHGIII